MKWEQEAGNWDSLDPSCLRAPYKSSSQEQYLPPPTRISLPSHSNSSTRAAQKDKNHLGSSQPPDTQPQTLQLLQSAIAIVGPDKGQ